MRIKTLQRTVGLLGFASVAALNTPPAIAKPSEAELAQPELQPEALLMKIVPAIQRSFVDPGSTQQFQLCRPHQAKMKDGALLSWAAMFVANTKNAAGGYGGRTIYTAIYRKGRVDISAGTSLLGGQQGFDMLIAREMERQTGNCPRIPDDKLKALLAG